MEITLVNCEYHINQNARAGMLPGFAMAEIQVVANNREEVQALITAMQSWANGTFEHVILEREDPDGPLVVTPVKTPEEMSPDEIDIDPITGYPR